MEEWKLKRCVNLYHCSIIGETFLYVKKLFGPVVSLHYENTLSFSRVHRVREPKNPVNPVIYFENTLFSCLFHLKGKLPIKTTLKFQQYFPKS